MGNKGMRTTQQNADGSINHNTHWEICAAGTTNILEDMQQPTAVVERSTNKK